MTVNVKYFPYRSEIIRLLYTPAGEVYRGVRKWGEQVEKLAAIRAPKQTGRLSTQSMVMMKAQIGAGKTIATVYFYAPYAGMVHQGTGLYGPRGRMIRKRRPMRFRSRTGARGPYAYTHTSRGQRPKPFLVSALRLIMLPKGAIIRTYSGVQRGANRPIG